MAPPPPYLMKPEMVLKRAEELCAVGQSQQALRNLHDVITSKRYRQYVPAHDQLMRKLVQLAVQLRKNRPAKEALHAFKNLVQNVQIESLQDVIHALLDGARQRVEEARVEADRRLAGGGAAGAATTVKADVAEGEETDEDVPDELDADDLLDGDADDTPESVMMRLMGGGTEDAKDRTDREVVAPWMRFQWEAYRSVLDVLKNNTKLEALYQVSIMYFFIENWAEN